MRRGLRWPPLETAALAFALLALIALTVARERAAPRAPTLDSFSSYDAASGGYRGLYEVLGREGLPVARFERPLAFLGAEGFATLVWAEPSRGDPRAVAPTRGDLSALVAWVRAGGHFVYVGSDERAARAGLLHVPHARPARAHGRAAFVVPALRALGIAPLESAAPLRWQVTPPARVLVADAAGPLVVTYGYGRGRVTAIVDEALFSNGELAHGDRARLAVALVGRPAGTPGPIAFEEAIHGYAVGERWWQVVPRPFLAALALAALAFGIAAAGAALRFGPPLVPSPRDDRGSADFVAALAALWQRGGAAQHALREAQLATARTLGAEFGVGPAAPGDVLLARLPTTEREAYARLARLAAQSRPDEQALVRGVALAHTLRKESYDRSRR